MEHADIPEDRLEGEAPAAYVRRVAEEKAGAVWRRVERRYQLEDGLIVLGADTCVVCDEEVLGKPLNHADGERMLRLLSGRAHQVLTGIAVATRHGIASDVESTLVTFNPIAEEELAHYIASGEPFDKAGAYGIQGYAARWIPRIEGCYFNVVGLPLARVTAMLRAARRA